MELRQVINPKIGERYYAISGLDEFGEDIWIEGEYSCCSVQDGIQSYYTKHMIDGITVRQLFKKTSDMRVMSLYRLAINPKIGQRYYGIVGKDEFGENIYVEGIYSCYSVQDGMQSYYTKHMLDGVEFSQVFKPCLVRGNDISRR